MKYFMLQWAVLKNDPYPFPYETEYRGGGILSHIERERYVKVIFWDFKLNLMLQIVNSDETKMKMSSFSFFFDNFFPALIQGKINNF